VSLLGHTLDYISDWLTSVADISTRSAPSACFVIWWPRCAADTSTNWWPGFLCCRAVSMEQAADRPEAAATHFSVNWKHFFLFHLRAPKNRLVCFVMRPRSTSRRAQYKYLGCCYSVLYWSVEIPQYLAKYWTLTHTSSTGNSKTLSILLMAVSHF